jgi:hypothetical protein
VRDWLALRNVFLSAILLAASLLVLSVAVGQGATTFIVPPPDTVAEEFVRALKAHRYEGAKNELSAELQQQVSDEELTRLVYALGAGHQGIEEAHGESAEEQGDTATATVQVKLGSGQEESLEFALRKEQGEWKLSSIDSLRQLAQSGSP